MGDNGKENGDCYNGLYRGSIGFNIRLYGWLSKLWSPFLIPILMRHLRFRVPKKGPDF